MRTLLLGLVSVLFLGFFIGALFMLFSPQFGAKASEADLHQYQQSPNFQVHSFHNTVPTHTGMKSGTFWSTLKQYLVGNPNKTPAKGVVTALPVSSADLTNPAEATRLLWFGHSTFLLQHQGQNFLFDPVFSDVPSPVAWLGTPRYSGGLPIEPEQLPNIDAVFISHDHYDHLDYESIKVLEEKVSRFYTPLGVGKHLALWGVPPSRITELDWWQDANLGDITMTLTPARHFSGRRLTGQNQTLWGAWLLRDANFSLYFSGDTGYGPHFREVFERYGAVEFALLECGQYNQNWADIHMTPEETVQVAQDLQAKIMMPVHWGAFTLSLHDWYDPAVRVTAAAEKFNQPLVIPQIGELMVISDEPKPRNAWWQTLSAELRSSF